MRDDLIEDDGRAVIPPLSTPPLRRTGAGEELVLLDDVAGQVLDDFERARAAPRPQPHDPSLCAMI